MPSSPAAGLPRQHGDGAEIAGGLRVGQMLDAVRQHADLHAGAIEPGQAAEDGRSVRNVRLRRGRALTGADDVRHLISWHRTVGGRANRAPQRAGCHALFRGSSAGARGERALSRLDEHHVGLRRERLDLVEVHVQPEITGRCFDQLAGDTGELRKETVGHVRLDVHDHVAIGCVGDIDFERLDTWGHGQPLLHSSRVDQLGIDLLLGGRTRFFLLEQRLDLGETLGGYSVPVQLLLRGDARTRRRRAERDSERRSQNQHTCETCRPTLPRAREIHGRYPIGGEQE